LINNLLGGTVLGRPDRGGSQVEKLPCLNWATQFLTAYDSACSPKVSVRISLGTLPCREEKERKKKKTSMTADILMLLKFHHCLTCFLSAFVTRKDLQFGT
jgi:hypothetical protein